MLVSAGGIPTESLNYSYGGTRVVGECRLGSLNSTINANALNNIESPITSYAGDIPDGPHCYLAVYYPSSEQTGCPSKFPYSPLTGSI